jgi:hypothetical protein
MRHNGCILFQNFGYRIKNTPMRPLLILLVTLFTAPVFACGDQFYRLSLNQRSFYNPAAMCPYCLGSPYLSYGINFTPGEYGRGQYASFGNDGPNLAHGPWDFTYANSRAEDFRANVYSVRYAYAQNIDPVSTWKVAAGFRVSYFNIHQDFEELNTSTNAIDKKEYRSRMLDVDAGAMLTNAKGFYVGFSVQHLGSPQQVVSNENGVTHLIGLNRSYTIMAGHVQRITDTWDILPDAAFMKSDDETVTQGILMLRYLHHFALGAGAIFSNTQPAQFEIRGGYTGSNFKWLVSASPSLNGWSFETGVVLRFVQQDCTGGSCKPPRDRDDFRKHR